MRATMFHAIAFLSAAAFLVLMTVWTRMLRIWLGAPHAASVIAISAMTAGAALGFVSIWRAARHLRNPSRLHAALQAGVAVAALAMPELFRATRNVGVVSYLGYFVLATAFLAIPAALAGGALHLLIARIGAWGLLATALGGAAGAAAATTLLLPRFGLYRATLAAAALSFALAVAIVIGRDVPRLRREL